MPSTLTPDQEQLRAALVASGLDVVVDEYAILNIQVPLMAVWISTRPHYCDRGRWLVHAESLEPHLLTIDWSDGFPRYFFHVDTLVKELSTWLNVRLRAVKPTHETGNESIREDSGSPPTVRKNG